MEENILNNDEIRNGLLHEVVQHFSLYKAYPFGIYSHDNIFPDSRVLQPTFPNVYGGWR
jgi:hypothetical protein